MSFVGKEIPTGTVDWVNKVFTTLNVPLFVDDLWVDWAIYTSYNITGNVITLVDAPTVSIFLDYVTGTSDIPVTSTVTLGQMRSKIWDLLGQRPTSINFSPDRLQSEIQNVSLDVWRGRKTSVLNNQVTYRAWNLWFQEARVNFRIKGGSMLTSVLEIWDTVAEMNTSNILGAGYVLIGGDIVIYTNKTDTQIEGISGVTAEHMESERVIQLYTLPADFETLIGLRKVVDTGDWVVYRDIPLNTWFVSYEILRKWTVVLLKVNSLCGGDLIEVKYAKKYNQMNEDSDICPFPDQYGLTVIATIVAGEMGYVKSLENSERILNLGYTGLKSMFQYFTNETKVIKQKLTAKPYTFNSIRGWRIIR